MLDNLGNLERTHSCGDLRPDDVGKTVTLMGWVAKRRDFGELTFLDLRDRDGLTQVVLNSDDAPQAHAKAKEVRGEYVIAVTGEVTLRDESQRNPKLETGEVEVHARELLLLNDARTLPFQLETASTDALASEDLRLKYRYLDLRRPQLQANLRLRHRVLREIRRYMDEQGFTEIETPILIKSTPEGARDYIVPSRVQPGKFFALPQSPQLFKQLCMIAGLDKYFQIARCFRDEDLRADRQPEFTQLDLEMSFATLDQIYAVTEGLFARVFKLIGVELPLPFPRFSYAESMQRWGSDKPDLRIAGMELQDLAPALAGTDFAPYAAALAAGGEVKGIVVRGGAGLSRKTLDDLQEFAKRYGASGLAWIKLGDETSSSLLKALGEAAVVRLAATAGAEKGDSVLIVAGKTKTVAASLGALRNEVARREKLTPAGVYAPLWVTEFPMFEYHEDDDRYYAMHHPFTSPLDEDLPLLERAVEGGETALLGKLRTKAYDPVINGVELASGSIRIHRRDVQRLVFKALGMTTEEARSRFGFFLDALEFGTPPHGGIAPGIERLLMVLVPTENIRDVMAFPKTASATDLMIDAPGEVDPKQLDELSIRVAKGRELELLLRWLLNQHEAHGLKAFSLERLVSLIASDEVTRPSAEFQANYHISPEELVGITSVTGVKVTAQKLFDLVIDGIEVGSGTGVQLVIKVKERKPLAVIDLNHFFLSVVPHLLSQKSENPTTVTIPILIHPAEPEEYQSRLLEYGSTAVPWVGIDLGTLVREVIKPSLEQPSITEGAKSRLVDYLETLNF